MRTLVKRAVLRAYELRLLSFNATCWVFRHIDLKEV